MPEFIRGFFWVQPAPHHRAFHQWMRGKSTSCTLMLLTIPVTIFAAGFYAGRTF